METECVHLHITLENYCDWLKGDVQQSNPLADFPRTRYCCYIDYNYMKDMFCDNQNVFSHVTWDALGLPEFDGSDSTIWIGSEGANTPCHQDTYGFNLVTQIQGRKLWILFPPEDSSFLYPCRIPYEESSIFSAVNVRNPDLTLFPNFKNCHPVVVTLCPGQTLYVPRHWWHFVQSLEPSISVNIWVPVSEDKESRYYEAITRALASSLFRDFAAIDSDNNGACEMESWLNPTETLADSNMNLALLQTSLKLFLDNKESPKSNVGEEDGGRDFETFKSVPTTRRRAIPEDPLYLSKLASALAPYPVSQATSPFELRCLKRQTSETGNAEEEEETSKTFKVSKKPKLTFSSESVTPCAMVEDSEQISDVEEGLNLSKKLISINSCPFDVYMAFMRDLYSKNVCVSTSNSPKLEHDDKSAQNSQSVSKESHTDDKDSNIVNFKSGALESSSKNSSLVMRTGKVQNVADVKHSVISTSECVNSSESLLSSRILDDEGKEVRHPSHTAMRESSRPASELQSLTTREVAEALLASVLHPDIVEAVAAKFSEQCERFVRAKNHS